MATHNSEGTGSGLTDTGEGTGLGLPNTPFRTIPGLFATPQVVRRNPTRNVRQRINNAADNVEPIQEEVREEPPTLPRERAVARPAHRGTNSGPTLMPAIASLFEYAGMTSRDERLGRTTDQLKDLAAELLNERNALRDPDLQPLTPLTVRELISYESWRDYNKRELKTQDTIADELTKAQALPKSIPQTLVVYKPNGKLSPVEFVINLCRGLRHNAFNPRHYQHALACLVPEVDARMIRAESSFRAATAAFLKRYIDLAHMDVAFEKLVDIRQSEKESVHQFNVRFNACIHNLLLMFLLQDNHLEHSAEEPQAPGDDVNDPLLVDDLLTDLVDTYLKASNENPLYSMFYMRALRTSVKHRVARCLRYHRQDGNPRPSLHNVQELSSTQDDPLLVSARPTKAISSTRTFKDPKDATATTAKTKHSSAKPADKSFDKTAVKPKVHGNNGKKCEYHPHSTSHTTAECKTKQNAPAPLTQRRIAMSTEQAQQDTAMREHWADIDEAYEEAADEGTSSAHQAAPALTARRSILKRTKLTHRVTTLRHLDRTRIQCHLDCSASVANTDYNRSPCEPPPYGRHPGAESESSSDDEEMPILVPLVHSATGIPFHEHAGIGGDDLVIGIPDIFKPILKAEHRVITAVECDVMFYTQPIRPHPSPLSAPPESKRKAKRWAKRRVSYVAHTDSDEEFTYPGDPLIYYRAGSGIPPEEQEGPPLRIRSTFLDDPHVHPLSHYTQPFTGLGRNRPLLAPFGTCLLYTSPSPRD